MAIRDTKKETHRSEGAILIVDDNPDEAEITGRVLSKIRKDLTIRTSQSGEAAFRALQGTEELPAIIFLDLKMPGMSGLDLLRRIRSDRRLGKVRVVILTNSALEADRRESFAAGADWFLQKAFDLDQFSRELRPLLDRWLEQ